MALHCALIEVCSEIFQWLCIGIAANVLARLSLGLADFVSDFGNAVRNIVDNIETVDILFSQQINRLRFLLTKHRDQHIGADNFLLAG